MYKSNFLYLRKGSHRQGEVFAKYCVTHMVVRIHSFPQKEMFYIILVKYINYFFFNIKTLKKKE